MLEHTREPLAARPGTRVRIDDEYVRCGTANIFLAVEPLTGEVVLHPTYQRTARDCAEFLRYLADEVHGRAARVVLVCDNLNTHTAACLYEAFPPEEARRFTERFEIHHTPKHGSWLNVAECELSVMSRACLTQRIGSIGELHRTLNAWIQGRRVKAVHWQFSAEQARIKLRRLYPITSTETGH